MYSTEAAIASAQRDKFLVDQILHTHQPGEGEQLARDRLASQFLYEALEYSELPLLKPFTYQRVEVEGIEKYVANGEEWDITELTSLNYRRGTQHRAMKNLKELAAKAEVGTSFFRISLMQQPGENPEDCNYKKTQIDVFTKTESGALTLVQLQTRNVNTLEQAEALLRWWSEDLQLEEDSDLDQLLEAVGSRRSQINIDELLASIDEKPVPNLDELIEEVEINAVLAAEKYLLFIQAIPHLDEVSLYHDMLVRQLVYKKAEELKITVGVTLEANCPTKNSSAEGGPKRCSRCGGVNICYGDYCNFCQAKL